MFQSYLELLLNNFKRLYIYIYIYIYIYVAHYLFQLMFPDLESDVLLALGRKSEFKFE